MEGFSSTEDSEVLEAMRRGFITIHEQMKEFRDVLTRALWSYLIEYLRAGLYEPTVTHQVREQLVLVCY